MRYTGCLHSTDHQAARYACRTTKARCSQLCEAGLGVAVLSAFDLALQVHSGQLLRLLPEWDWAF